MGHNFRTTKKEIIEKRDYRNNIQGDAFSLYVSSYPIAIKYLAQRIGDSKKIVCELCCGVGVTLEYLGPYFKELVGVDWDEQTLTLCRKNLSETGLLNKTTLVHGDVRDKEIIEKIKSDIVIYDIPNWNLKGRKENPGNENPDLGEMIYNIRKYISNEILVFAPPYFKYKEIEKSMGECEFQQVFINGRHDRNHIYFGKLVDRYGATKIRL